MAITVFANVNDWYSRWRIPWATTYSRFLLQTEKKIRADFINPDYYSPKTKKEIWNLIRWKQKVRYLLWFPMWDAIPIAQTQILMDLVVRSRVLDWESKWDIFFTPFNMYFFILYGKNHSVIINTCYYYFKNSSYVLKKKKKNSSYNPDALFSPSSQFYNSF